MPHVPRPALAALVAAATATTVAAVTPPQLEPLAFLLGTWVTGPTGTPGERVGRATFTRELLDRVIVRRSFADTVPVGDGPTFHHEDLTVIHVAEDGAVRADYFDDEGHVIRYRVTVTAPGAATFETEAGAPGSRYRLSYRLVEGECLAGRFETASPGEAGAFTPYLSWTSCREKVDSAATP